MGFPSLMPDETIADRVVTGEVKKFVPNEHGGWFLILAPRAGRFRADSSQFTAPPAIGSLVSFLPAEKKAGSLRRVMQILFQIEEHMNNTNYKSTLNDCYYVGGSHFPVPDENTSKGGENGPQELVAQSDRQKDSGLNGSEGINRSSTWSAEGKAFPVAPNSKASDDESPTFAGDRDSTVSINLGSGQIESVANTRTVNDKKLRDVKANRI